LDEVAGQFRVELATRREAEAELEALWSLAAQVRDFTLDDADGPSSLATSMSMVAKQLKSRIEPTTSNELDVDLEVLRFGRNAGLTEDEVDALRSRVRVAANSLTSHVLSSVARNPPDGAGE
jgi:hypothetical protein